MKPPTSFVLSNSLAILGGYGMYDILCIHVFIYIYLYIFTIVLHICICYMYMHVFFEVLQDFSHRR